MDRIAQRIIEKYGSAYNELLIYRVNNWNGHEMYCANYAGGEIGARYYYEIVDGRPIRLNGKAYGQLVRDHYDPGEPELVERCTSPEGSFNQLVQVTKQEKLRD